MSDTQTETHSEPAPMETRAAEPIALPAASAADVPNWLAEASQPQPVRNQSLLFERLVQGEDDLIGLLAVGLYEQDRRDWVKSWSSTHGSPPVAGDMDAFITGHSTPPQIERYRAGSRQALEAYALAAVEYERPLMNEEAITARMERAARRVESGGRFGRQFAAALVAIITLAVIVAVVVGGLHYAGVDIAAVLRPYFSG